MGFGENRTAVHIKVHEERKRRQNPFAAPASRICNRL